MLKSTKKTTWGKFNMAISAARKAMIVEHPKTKLAYYCEMFLQINEDKIAENNKIQRDKTKDLVLELNQCRIDHALMKDGIVWKNEEKQYQYDTAGEKAVKEKEALITDQMAYRLEDFFKEEVEVDCICSPLELPESISFNTNLNLNGFVYKNKNEFEEKIELITETE